MKLITRKSRFIFLIVFLTLFSMSYSTKAIIQREKSVLKISKESLKNKIGIKQNEYVLPCHGGCSCNSRNNKRSVLPGSTPIEPESYQIKNLSNYPINFTIEWNQQLITDLDIHLKSINGIDIPRDYNHRVEFNNKVTRTERNGILAQSDGAESLTIKGILPKGEYLLYVYNCANTNPLINSNASIIMKTGINNENNFTLTIPIDQSAINSRVWRIGIIESNGVGEMKLKIINRVNKSVEVKFDGKILENRYLDNKDNALPCLAGCNCDPKNNKRTVASLARPIEPQSYPVKTISDFPILFTLDWNHQSIADLDIRLKSTNGIDFPRDYNHRVEFNNQVTRTERNGLVSGDQTETLTIKGILPKGEYLLYIYNCANTNPLINSNASIIMKTGTNNQNNFKLNIPEDQSAINYRIWRIGIIESNGSGEMKLKIINRVSKSNKLNFDGKILENRRVENKNIPSPCIGGCNCDASNNKRPVVSGAKPLESKISALISLTDFPILFTLDWNHQSIADLDIRLKSSNGIDFPRDYNHKIEFNNQVTRTERNGLVSGDQTETLTIKGILPKGEYLLYIYNCANTNPLINSKASLNIKTGINSDQDNLTIFIPEDHSAINYRIWRMGIIKSDGIGEMKLKIINRVSNSNELNFDGNH